VTGDAERPTDGWTADEMMSVQSARALADARTCFVGIGLPSTAANLARAVHNPDLVLIYESGTIGAKPAVLPMSIGDGELAETADSVVPVPEIFAYWLQGGRCDVGFLGAAQIDRYANINTTEVSRGPGKPAVRLPGAGGAPEIAAHSRRVLVTARHSTRMFVETLDFVTTVGHGTGGRYRETLARAGAGPTAVITDLAILEPDPDTKELTLVAIHPGVRLDDVLAHTGWPLQVSSRVATTTAPSDQELTALRDLRRRTGEAHRPSAR
jgi:glutaconate CoA-transferase, subunit B